MPCEWVGTISDIAVAGSAVVAAYVAYGGVNAWQKELKGKSEYELAKEVLRSVFRVREAFKHIRHPSIYSFEYPQDLCDRSGHLAQEHKGKGTAHVYEQRWKKMDSAFSELEEKFLDALVEWGSENQEKIVQLRKCRAELLTEIQDYLSRLENPEQGTWKNKDEQKHERSVMYQSGPNSKYDTFTPEIESAVKELEDWLRPHVLRK